MNNREDIINAIEYLKERKENQISDWKIKSYKLAIHALEQQLNDRWIPISEGFPKKDGYYFFQTKYAAHEYYYENGKLYMDMLEDNVQFNKYDIIAWKPLPKSYKEE